jgi:hypothetical protein
MDFLLYDWTDTEEMILMVSNSGIPRGEGKGIGMKRGEDALIERHQKPCPNKMARKPIVPPNVLAA